MNKEHDRKIRGTEEPRDELTDTKHSLQKTENPAGILLIKLVLGWMCETYTSNIIYVTLFTPQSTENMLVLLVTAWHLKT